MPQIFHIKAKICREATLSGTTANKYWLLACWSCTESHLVCVVLFLLATCRSGCHNTRGYCEAPGECRCRLGWAGRNCSDCAVLPGCQRGTCQKPLECNCLPGYTGLLCQTGEYKHVPLYICVCVCVCAILNVRRWRSGCAAEFLLKINWKIP